MNVGHQKENLTHTFVLFGGYLFCVAEKMKIFTMDQKFCSEKLKFKKDLWAKLLIVYKESFI